MLRLIASLFATGGILLAAELPPLNLGRLNQKQFNKLLMRSLSNVNRLPSLDLEMKPFTPTTATCSIPLIEIKAASRFPNSGVVHAGNGKLDPIGLPPGPVCRNWLPK